MMSAEAARIISRPRISASRIILPTEHGSWAFLFEPLIAGSLIAYSPAAPWIALIAIGAFFARQPLKTYYIVRKRTDASASAIRYTAIFATISLIGAAAGISLAGISILYPLLISALLAALQFYLDISSKGRSLLAEIAGAAAISASAAMLIAAGGLGWPFAIAVWTVFTARFVPSILYVRNRLQLEKGKPFDHTMPIAAHLAGLVAVFLLAIIGLASFLTAAMFVFLLVRAIVGLSEYRSRIKAMRIGVWEVVYGVLTLVSIVIGYYAGI